MRASAWDNPQAVEMIRDLWLDPNFTASKIATEINAKCGLSISRFAVIGKADRLKLVLPATKKKLLLKERKYPPQARRRPQSPRPAWFNATPMEDDAIPIEQRKTLLELGPDDCRFIVGDPQTSDFFFCAAPVVEGKPYCPGHCARCFEIARPRMAYAFGRAA